MKFTGTARSVEFLEPGGLGGLLRNNRVFFLVDAQADLPTGKTSWIPVAFECFLKVPSFEGQTVEIEGEFDEFDRMVRGKRLSVKESGIFIGAIRSFGFFSALILLTVAVGLAWGIGFLSVWLYEQFNGIYLAGGIDLGRFMKLFLGGALGLVLVCAIGLTLLYASRVAIPAIYRVFYRFLRFIGEVRPKKRAVDRHSTAD